MSRLHGKMRPRLTGLPYLADRATRLGGLPHLSCKHDQIKMRDYMERRATPLRRVTPPTWGPPPPCKQALNANSNQRHASKNVNLNNTFMHIFASNSLKLNFKLFFLTDVSNYCEERKIKLSVNVYIKDCKKFRQQLLKFW